jgi:bisphosphoglycerate-dependent phosphoglycerate mutase
LRALIKYIEHISDEGVEELEMPFGGTIVYDVDKDGYMVAKHESRINSDPPHA